MPLVNNPILSLSSETTAAGVELDPGAASDLDLARSFDWQSIISWFRQLGKPQSLIPFLVLLALAILGLILRRQIARVILRLATKLLRKQDPEDQADMMRLEKPLAWLTAALIGRICFHLSAFPLSISRLGDRFFSTLTTAFAFYLLYEALQCLFQMYTRPRVKNGQTIDALFDENAVNYLSTFTRAIIIVLGAFSVLGIWIDNLGAVITGLGIGGLLLALAAQDSAANIFASMSIMLDKPFAIGDWIETPDACGTVVKVGMRSTRIKALDRSLITVPNSQMASAVIVNGTKRDARQVDARLNFAHNTDPTRIQALTEAIKALLAADEDILDGPVVSLDSIEETALTLKIRYYTSPNWAMMDEVRERINYGILELLELNGLELAVPRLHVIDGETEDG